MLQKRCRNTWQYSNNKLCSHKFSMIGISTLVLGPHTCQEEIKNADRSTHLEFYTGVYVNTLPVNKMFQAGKGMQQVQCQNVAHSW